MPFEIAVINDREKIEAHLNDGWEPFAATTSMVPTEYVGKPAGGIELVHVVFLRREAARPALDLGRFNQPSDT